MPFLILFWRLQHYIKFQIKKIKIILCGFLSFFSNVCNKIVFSETKATKIFFKNKKQKYVKDKVN